MIVNKRTGLLAVACAALSACCATPSTSQNSRSFAVFFSEFSANLSADTKAVIDQAASEAKRLHVETVRIEARANATGSADATMKIAETRAAVVRDALVADGVATTTIKLDAIGQEGTTDTGVGPRRVNIVFETGKR